MTTAQTAKGVKTTVTMVLASGGDLPSIIHLRDATFVKPAADGSISVTTEHIADLQAAGWAVKIASGATHVP